MLGIALGAFDDLGTGGLIAIAVVTLFVLFTFWASTLGSNVTPGADSAHRGVDRSQA